MIDIGLGEPSGVSSLSGSGPCEGGDVGTGELTMKLRSPKSSVPDGSVEFNGVAGCNK
jgi:hypothetical protein